MSVDYAPPCIKLLVCLKLKVKRKIAFVAKECPVQTIKCIKMHYNNNTNAVVNAIAVYYFTHMSIEYRGTSILH